MIAPTLTGPGGGHPAVLAWWWPEPLLAPSRAVDEAAAGIDRWWPWARI